MLAFELEFDEQARGVEAAVGAEVPRQGRQARVDRRLGAGNAGAHHGLGRQPPIGRRQAGAIDVVELGQRAALVFVRSTHAASLAHVRRGCLRHYA
jgi:hypothetical protein